MFDVSRINLAAAAGCAALALTQTADAKPAQCFTTDDGHFPCEFVATDRAGSFEISAAGYPSYSLIVDRPGEASAFADFGTGRNVALPGTFRRATDDGACWDNGETGVRLCAW